MSFNREVLKSVIKFGRREYSEKKPLTLKILRVKSKSILKRGLLPSLNIKQIRGTFFIIVSDYGDYFRIYSFGKNGQLFGGENIEKNPKTLKEILKATSLEYHLPKERPKLTIETVTRHYNEEFEKVLSRTNQLFGFNLKRPYTIIAQENLKLRMGRMIGCAKTRNKDKLVISVEAYKQDFFEVIITREIMYLYLRELIVLFQDIKEEVVYWYDLAILLTNFYLRNDKNEYLKNIMEKTTRSFLNFKDGSKYFFSDKVVEILKNNTKSYTTREANLLLSNVFNCLRIFKEYKIRLRYREFANFFFALCDLFIDVANNKFFKQTTKLDYYRFHLSHFKKTSEIDKDSIKTRFLLKSFSLLSNNHPEVKSFNNLIQEINLSTQDPIVQKEIINHTKLADDVLFEYIINHVLKINITHKIQNKSLEIEINIKNESNHVFQDFTYNISVKPRSRIKLLTSEGLKKSMDLHNHLGKRLRYTIESMGKISLFCHISFTNLFHSQNRMGKVVNLIKINLENKE